MCVVGVWQREIWTCGVCVWCDVLRTTVGGSSLMTDIQGCILFDGENISFDASLVRFIYIYIYIYIVIYINKQY